MTSRKIDPVEEFPGFLKGTLASAAALKYLSRRYGSEQTGSQQKTAPRHPSDMVRAPEEASAEPPREDPGAQIEVLAEQVPAEPPPEDPRAQIEALAQQVPAEAGSRVGRAMLKTLGAPLPEDGPHPEAARSALDPSDPKNRAVLGIYYHHASFMVAFGAVEELLDRAGLKKAVGLEPNKHRLVLEADDHERYESYLSSFDHHYEGFVRELRIVGRSIDSPDPKDFEGFQSYTQKLLADLQKFDETFKSFRVHDLNLGDLARALSTRLQKTTRKIGHIAALPDPFESVVMTPAPRAEYMARAVGPASGRGIRATRGM